VLFLWHLASMQTDALAVADAWGRSCAAGSSAVMIRLGAELDYDRSVSRRTRRD
jgi:hypothetical protein